MSALDDIRAALGKLKPPPRGAVRVILIGVSAERSIQCDLVPLARANARLPEKIDGVEIKRTAEFDGWEIRDCLASGRWIDAA